LLRLPSMRDVLFEFGYDEMVRKVQSGLVRAFTRHVIPGLRVPTVGRNWGWDRPHWAEHSYWFCPHSDACGSVSSIRYGCPSTPTIAEIGMKHDPEVVRIEIRPERIVDEQVFVLEIHVTRIYERDTNPNESPTSFTRPSEVINTATDEGNTVDEAAYSKRDRDSSVHTPSSEHPTGPSDSNTSMLTIGSLVSKSSERARVNIPYILRYNPPLVRSLTQQRILMGNRHGKFWKVLSDGLQEVPHSHHPHSLALPLAASAEESCQQLHSASNANDPSPTRSTSGPICSHDGGGARRSSTCDTRGNGIEIDGAIDGSSLSRQQIEEYFERHTTDWNITKPQR